MASERWERLGKIEEARDKAKQLNDAQIMIDELMRQLRAETYRLGEEWNDPAAREMQGIVADAMRQVYDATAALGSVARQLSAAADEADRHLDDEPEDERDAATEEDDQGV